MTVYIRLYTDQSRSIMRYTKVVRLLWVHMRNICFRLYHLCPDKKSDYSTINSNVSTKVQEHNAKLITNENKLRLLKTSLVVTEILINILSQNYTVFAI